MGDLPLVGRGALLDRVVEHVVSGRSVVVSGTVGVGKSRLAAAAATQVEDRGWVAHRVVATRAAASIPFGALVSLLPQDADAKTPFALLAAFRERLQTGADGRPHVLVIDDVPRLDVPSAALVHQVVTEQLCPVLGTARRGESAPDAIDALINGDAAVRIEVPTLSDRDLGELLEALLDGQCDATVVRVLSQLSGGNPLYARELVRDGIAAGWLAPTGQVWRVAGRPRAPARLVDFVGDRLAGLTGTARDAIEVLAIAERLDVEQLDSLVDHAAIEHLEHSGLARVEQDGTRLLAVLAHPLHGEAARARMSALRRRRVVSALADALERSGMPDPGDAVRVARWRLEGGGPRDPELFTRAARRAWMANDFALAEQLGRAAREAGAGFAAGFVVAECIMAGGRHDEAETALAELEPEAVSDDDRVRLASARANNFALGPGGEAAAIDILEQALAQLGDTAPGDTIRVRLAVIHVFAPRPRAALDAAAAVLARPESDQYFRATYATSLAHALLGNVDSAVAIGADGFANHQRFTSDTRLLPESQHIGPILALVAAGLLDRADALAGEGHARSVAAGDGESQATFAMLLGIVATQRGRMVTAGRHFREAAAINVDLNDDIGLRWSLGGAALAAGLSGDREGARAASDHLDAIATTGVQVLELDLVERGRAWHELAGGESTRGVERLRAAADVAAATEQFAVEAVLRHDLIRLGDAGPSAARFAELRGAVGGELIGVRVAHADALAKKDGDALEAAARAFANLGCHLDAMIAATQAAAAFRSGGRARPAARCETLALESSTSCEGATPPVARSVFDVAELTRREREVAALASEGLANREIADRLFLSARTVENHLQRVYEKLGITNRSDLAGALERNTPA